MRFRGRGCLALSLSLVVVTCSSDAVTDPTAASLRQLQPAAAVNGTIAFTTARDGNSEIYVMNPDGTGQTNRSNNTAVDDHPAWSPDGTKIAFMSTRDGDAEIHVMNADGTGVTNLTDHPGIDLHPAWSPDGTRIAFTSLRGGDNEIYVMNADGTCQINLTDHPNGDFRPTWSPDGTKIAFDTVRDGTFEIYVMNLDGTGQTRLTQNEATDDDPEWLPGSQIVFTSNRDLGFEIYSMNGDGTGVTRITNDAGAVAVDDYPTWSPDGTKIAFATARHGFFEIYVMSADGTGQTRLTSNGADDFLPSWGAEPGTVDLPSFPGPLDPGESDLDGDGIGDACEESSGSVRGHGTNRHGQAGDQPGATAAFRIDMSAQSPPAGTFSYDLGGARGRLTVEPPDGTVEYLETRDGRVWASGMGRWNGLLRGWCLIGRDVRRGTDALEVRIYAPGDEHFGSCASPRFRFGGSVESGGINVGG